MQIPVYVMEVLKTLQKNGQQALLVGGCVRDLILGKEPADYDVASSATVEEIKSLFPKTAAIGEKHGTVAVILTGGIVEVSTYKRRKDCRADPSLMLMEDLMQRDFTINAMAMDEAGSLIDPYGGLIDIENKLIRAPQNLACERFRDDPLRMMRAVRFCTTCDYVLHQTVSRAITELHDLIKGVSPERIQEELNRILISEQPSRGIKLLLSTGLLAHILPEAVATVGFDQRNSRHDKDVFHHTMAVIDAVPPKLKLRMAALLHDIGKPASFTVDENAVGHFYKHHLEGKEITENILRRLKYDKRTIDDVSILVSEHMSRFPRIRNGSLKRLINRVGDDNLEDLFDLQRADILASAPPFDFSELEAMQADINRICCQNPPMQLQDLAVNGNDLLDIGFKPGRVIGLLLKDLLDIVLDDPEKNNRETLLSLALNIADLPDWKDPPDKACYLPPG